MKQNRSFTYSRGLLLYGAIVILVVPLRLLLAFVISAAVHELFHALALIILKVEIRGVHIGVQGAKIFTGTMSGVQELLSAAAGPLGGFLLFSCYRWIPVISLCALVQSCYNLLPVYPSDGGRILRCAAAILLPNTVASRVVYGIEVLALCMIVGAGVYGSLFLGLGILPILIGISLLLNGAKRK